MSISSQQADATQTRERGSSAAPVLRLPWWPAWLAAALTAVVAFWGMTKPQFWFDETATISAVERPLSSLVGMLSDIDAVHGLYYAVMFPWVRVFGTSELAMRTPSAIALMIAAFALTRIGMTYAQRFMTQRVVFTGLMIAVVGAVLPGLSWAGQEARGYAMAVMSVALAWWAFERYAATRNGLLVVGFGVSMAAATGFSMYSIFLLPVFFLRSLRWGWRHWLNILIACALVATACLPLAFIGMTQSAQVDWINLTTADVFRAMVLTLYFISPRNITGEYSDAVFAVAPYLAALTALVVVAGIALSRARWMLLWVASMILLPCAIVLAAQMSGRQFFQERYLTFTTPALILLIAMGLAAIPWRVLGAVLAAALVGLSVPSLLAQNGEYAKEDGYRTSAEEAAQADTVVFMAPPLRGLFIAYPPEEDYNDPMLAIDPQDSESLWGVNIPYEQAWEMDQTGSVAVVSYSDDPNYPLVEDHLLENQCTLTDDTRREPQYLRFRVTTFDCPQTDPDQTAPGDQTDPDQTDQTNPADQAQPAGQ
ncbi:glycosyltransferase family 39 protein [Kocuria sp.]|uniref:glycosyltransferase family 39 protein n=1 Tax=Kocuria sp. TaxID=1871328 RepID=UPI0026DEE0DC|nr:hypothetical protein [Kocuria sp.]MDO5619235.1 hypothetical protein [Kocuria sp.]